MLDIAAAMQGCSHASIDASVFSNNFAVNGGGALYGNSSAVPFLVRCAKQWDPSFPGGLPYTNFINSPANCAAIGTGKAVPAHGTNMNLGCYCVTSIESLRLYAGASCNACFIDNAAGTYASNVGTAAAALAFLPASQIIQTGFNLTGGLSSWMRWARRSSVRFCHFLIIHPMSLQGGALASQ